MRRRIGLACAAALSGCALAEPPELDVEAQWGEAMRRLGMFAFYPATESAQVGDVFLLVPPPSGPVAWWGRQLDAVVPGSRPDHDGARFSLVRIATLSPGAAGRAAPRPVAEQERFTLRQHLEAQQGERLHIEPLPAPPRPDEGVAQADTSRQPPQLRPSIPAQASRLPQVGHADQEAIMPRLQRSAIPALHVARLSEAQLNASGVFGNAGAFLGLNSGRQTALTIALGNVQELQLDAWRAAALYETNATRLFGEQIAPEDLLFWLRTLRHGRNDRYDLTEAACNGDREALQNQGMQLAVVTRVLYAGSIEYGFSRSAEASVRAAADLAAVFSGAATPQIPRTQAPAAAPAPQPGTTPPAPPTDPALRAQQQLAARFAGLPTLTHPSDPRAGAQLSLGVGSFGSLSLRETFNRPVAVGAGSRFVISFHQALAGTEGQRALRLTQAEEECARIFASRGQTFARRGGLWKAMGGVGDPPPPRVAPDAAAPSVSPRPLSPAGAPARLAPRAL